MVSPVVDYPPIQFVKDQTREVKIKGVRFTEVISGGEPYVEATLTWRPEEETGIVTFKALEPGDVSEHPIVVLTQDEVDISLPDIRAEGAHTPVAAPPLDVSIAAHAKREIRGKTERRDGAHHLLSPITASKRRRGPARPTTPRSSENRPAPAMRSTSFCKQIQPATPDEVQSIWKRFYPEEEVAKRPRLRRGRLRGEPPAPEPAPTLGPARPIEPGRAAAPAPPQGAFVFLDDTVDDGESYVYKIVTLNVQPDLRPPTAKSLMSCARSPCLLSWSSP